MTSKSVMLNAFFAVFFMLAIAGFSYISNAQAQGIPTLGNVTTGRAVDNSSSSSATSSTTGALGTSSHKFKNNSTTGRASIKKNTAPIKEQNFYRAQPRLPLPANVRAADALKNKCQTTALEIEEIDGDLAQQINEFSPVKKPGKGFGLGEKEQQTFLEVAECRSQELYGYFRRILYIYAGIGIVAMVTLAFTGRWNWKWLFAYIAGLFVLAAGQYIVEFLN